MEIQFDHALVGAVGEFQPSLLLKLNGKDCSINHGVHLAHGKFGSIAITGIGRFTYERYNCELPVGELIDSFELCFNDGAIYQLMFVMNNSSQRFTSNKFLFWWDGNEWEDVTEQLTLEDEILLQYS